MGRRGKGEGSISQRASDGLWQGSISVFGKRKYVYGQTRAEVVEKLKPYKLDLEAGILPTDLSMLEFLDHWLVWKAPYVGPRTRDYYEDIVRTHLEPRFAALGRIPLNRLNAAHGAKLIDALNKAGVSHRRQKRVLTVLKGALSDAVGDMHLLAAHPLLGFRVPKLKTDERAQIRRVKKTEIWTHEEGRKFLGHCREKAENYYPIYVVALMMGMREGEILGLQWEDIDFRAKQITVRHNLITYLDRSKPKGERMMMELGPPKSDAGFRTLAMPDELVKVLRRMNEGAVPLHGRSGFVFRSKDPIDLKGEHAWSTEPIKCSVCKGTHAGRPTLQSSLLHRYAITKAAANVPLIRFHDLRHTAATWWIAAGVSPDEVRRRLGHSQIALTMDRYAEFWPAGDKAVASKMDDLVAGWNL